MNSVKDIFYYREFVSLNVKLRSHTTGSKAVVKEIRIEAKHINIILDSYFILPLETYISVS